VISTAREIDGVSVVVKGLFNPAIFSPAWLLSQDLIGSSEYTEAQVDIISRDLAVFRAAWLSCQVTPDAMQISTNDPDEFERARDVAAGVLGVLHHTPIAAMGINREVHLLVPSASRWHGIGDILAPKAAWESALIMPGMRSVTMWGIRPDSYAGRVQVQVEPSLRMPRAVYVAHNDHYILARVDSQPTSREAPWYLEPELDLEPTADKLEVALSILADDWHSSLERANEVVSLIAKLGQ